MSEEKNKENIENTGEHTPYSSKNVHSEKDNSTKDGLKINNSKNKSEEKKSEK